MACAILVFCLLGAELSYLPIRCVVTDTATHLLTALIYNICNSDHLMIPAHLNSVATLPREMYQ